MADTPARLRTLPADTLAALAFFSRVPVKPEPVTFDMRRLAGAWPAAGFVLALPPAILFLLASSLHIPATVGAVLVLAAFAVLTGGMHEDGLADTADGFGGGATRGEKLAIMRDSRLGTFGGLALILSMLLKAAAIGVIGASPWRAAVAIAAAAVISRALALWHWRATEPARTEGMAVSAGRPDEESLVVAAVAALVAAIVLVLALKVAALLGILLAAGAVHLFTQLVRQQIGGHTGDTIGAAQQIAEALLFAGLASASASALAG